MSICCAASATIVTIRSGARSLMGKKSWAVAVAVAAAVAAAAALSRFERRGGGRESVGVSVVGHRFLCLLVFLLVERSLLLPCSLLSLLQERDASLLRLVR